MWIATQIGNSNYLNGQITGEILIASAKVNTTLVTTAMIIAEEMYPSNSVLATSFAFTIRMIAY